MTLLGALRMFYAHVRTFSEASAFCTSRRSAPSRPRAEQADCTARRTSLSSLVFGMFNHANAAGNGDVEKLIQENPEARALAFEHVVKSRPPKKRLDAIPLIEPF